MKEDFIWALFGGSLIGLATFLMLYFNGKVAGISGIINGVMDKQNSESKWRFSFLLGLFTGGMILQFFIPSSFQLIPYSPFQLIMGGLLVGFGTVLGNGCTSGHGVCGISRLSPRSMIATITFMLAGFLIVGLLNPLGS